MYGMAFPSAVGQELYTSTADQKKAIRTAKTNLIYVQHARTPKKKTTK